MVLLLRHNVWESETPSHVWVSRQFLILPFEHLSLFKMLCGRVYASPNLVLLFDLFILKTPNDLFFVMFLHHESFSCSLCLHWASLCVLLHSEESVLWEKRPPLKAGIAYLWFSFIAEVTKASCFLLCTARGTGLSTVKEKNVNKEKGETLLHTGVNPGALTKETTCSLLHSLPALGSLTCRRLEHTLNRKESSWTKKEAAIESSLFSLLLPKSCTQMNKVPTPPAPRTQLHIQLQTSAI